MYSNVHNEVTDSAVCGFTKDKNLSTLTTKIPYRSRVVIWQKTV